MKRSDITAETPEPQMLDFTCPRCHAPPGTACTVRGTQSTSRHHAPRIDRRNRARTHWLIAQANIRNGWV